MNNVWCTCRLHKKCYFNFSLDSLINLPLSITCIPAIAVLVNTDIPSMVWPRPWFAKFQLRSRSSSMYFKNISHIQYIFKKYVCIPKIQIFIQVLTYIRDTIEIRVYSDIHKYKVQCIRDIVPYSLFIKRVVQKRGLSFTCKQQTLQTEFNKAEQLKNFECL